MISERTRQLEARWAGPWPDQLRAPLEMRATLGDMQEALYRFQLTSRADHRERFLAAARRMGEWVEQARPEEVDDASAEAFSELEGALGELLAQTQDLLGAGVRTIRRETPAQVDELVQARLLGLEAAVDRWTEGERLADERRVTEVAKEFRSLRQLLVGWGLGLAGLAGVLGVWHYHGLALSVLGDGWSTRAAAARQERLASLEVFAAGVAHEIRNPLTALKFRLFSLKQALPGSLIDNPDLATLDKELDRLERIVKDFLALARPADPRCTRLAVAEVVQEVYQLLREDLERHGIGVRVQADAEVEVHADRSQLHQVLINLVQNARDSMNGGGQLTLAVRAGAASWLRRARGLVLVEVTDTGQGIPADVEPRIFDPFFTTREGGSGLGLSIAARIAELHGGHLQYATRPGAGTTFTLVLPSAASHEGSHTVNRG